MNIHGFTTKELLKALTAKATKDVGELFAVYEIPELLERFLEEMAANVYDVSNSQ